MNTKFHLSFLAAALLAAVSQPAQAGPARLPAAAPADASQPALPPGHPPLPGKSETALPPGHPPIPNQGDAALPPGHPPIPAQPDAALPPGHPPLDMSQQTLPPGSTSDVGNPKWTVPADWSPGMQSTMRRASFAVKNATGKADIAVTVFPGDVGGPLANINRWRGQISLPPIAQKQVEPATTKLDVNGIPATLVDFTNEKTNQRMIVATIPHAGNSWFVKMTGDVAVVAAQKANLIKFVESVKF